jgi:alkyl sulfatase BDS1-like metallo-beta-lactamase superfamily hydrolase
VTSLRQISNDLLSGALEIEAAHPMQPQFVVEEVAAGTHFVASFANVTAFTTEEGLVLVDTGSFLLANMTRQILRRATTVPAHTAVWTHGHVDHCFGVEHYEQEHGPVRVIAHEAVLRRFDRYKRTQGYNTQINRRQFQTDAQFPSEFRTPDEIYATSRTIEVGGRTFDLVHALGETDDHTWVFSEGVLCTGDMFIWASPNCGNPQKVQRFPREWAAALRAMDTRGAEVLCPGHGVPIWGAAAVHRALDETASYLESLVEQTLAMLNRGARLDEILHAVRPDPALAQRPYLAPVYDEPEFVLRNLYRLYAGWWDGNPAHLKPAPDAVLAKELADLAGGARVLADRARTTTDVRLACELIELAALAAPDDAEIKAARAAIYEARASGERSLMARGIYASAARPR